MPFLPPNQQLQSTEGKYLYLYHLILITLISTLNSNTYTNSDFNKSASSLLRRLSTLPAFAAERQRLLSIDIS